MKQSKELNKAIENAIKAAHAEREEMEKQRDIWERAIQEKDRQIDTLNGMLTPRKLAASIEVEEEKEKTFNEVWGEFVKTLDNDTIESKGCLERGKKWCELFYNYHQINTSTLTSSYGHSDVEHYIFVPFLKNIGETHMLINREEYEIEICNTGYIKYNNHWLLDNTEDDSIIQRIKTTS